MAQVEDVLPEDEASKNKSTESIESSGQHEQGMASWIHGLARRYILSFNGILFLLWTLAAGISRICPKWAKIITGSMFVASAIAQIVYLLRSHGDQQESLMALISTFLPFVFAFSFMRLASPPPTNLEEKLDYVMLLSSGLITLTAVVSSTIKLRAKMKLLDAVKISAPPSTPDAKSDDQVEAEKKDLVDDIKDENASSSRSHEAASENTVTEDISDKSSSSFATVAAPAEKITHAGGIGTMADDREENKPSRKAELAESIEKELEKNESMQECLHYCSLFPADYEFSRDTLIWSWTAAGLINSEQSGEMEAVAIRLFDGLIALRCIVESGYDHLSDQMKYKLETDKFSLLSKQPSPLRYRKNVSNDDSDMAEVEHLSLIFEQIDQIRCESIQKCTRLKTLLLHKSCGSDFQSLLHDLFLGLKLLTSLDMSGTNVEELPSSITNLKVLRYLDMSETPIRQLPESIDSLACLETLILLRCLSLRGLPTSTNKLVNLKHLVLDLTQLLYSMPNGVGKLTNLQTLGAFVVGTKDGNRIGELGNTNKLKGSLCLMKLENILKVEEAREARLCDKQYLSKLEFIWSDVQDAEDTKEKEILESLKPHFGLQDLKIVSYSGVVLPSWISDPSFTQMTNITLYGCRYCTSLPSLGELPSLKSLSIVDMKELVCIDRLFTKKHDSQNQQQAFPKLERLSLEGMSNLEKWEGVEDGHFPCLQELLIKYCPKLTALPTLSYFPSLQDLEICYCPELLRLPRKELPPLLRSLVLHGCADQLEEQYKAQIKNEDNVQSSFILYINHEKIEFSRSPPADEVEEAGRSI